MLAKCRLSAFAENWREDSRLTAPPCCCYWYCRRSQSAETRWFITVASVTRHHFSAVNSDGTARLRPVDMLLCHVVRCHQMLLANNNNTGVHLAGNWRHLLSFISSVPPPTWRRDLPVLPSFLMVVRSLVRFSQPSNLSFWYCSFT